MGRRIAIISGVCVAHDAISNAMRDEKVLLEAEGYEVRLFAQAADDVTAPDVQVMADSFDLIVDPFYRDADLAMFHFGVHYRLFNALLLSGGQRRVVYFHNVTPPALLDGTARALAESSLDQLSIAGLADEVWAVSDHNVEVLHDHADVEPNSVRRLGLHVPSADDPQPRRSAGVGEAVTVLAVGRFVRPKGLAELVAAMGVIPCDLGPLRLVLAGSTTFSDGVFLDELRVAIESLPAHVAGQVVENPDDDELRSLYSSAHVFVSASHHEGFCLPVWEALAHGCRVVSTDAGALPESVGPCGDVVPVGDVQALSVAIAGQIEATRAPSAPSALPAACVAHLAQVGTEQFRSRLLDAVGQALVSRGD